MGFGIRKMAQIAGNFGEIDDVGVLCLQVEKIRLMRAIGPIPYRLAN